MKPKRRIPRQVVGLVCAVSITVAIVFISSNLRNWSKEKSALFDDVAVRWGEDSYIPNLDVGFSSTLPDWLAGRLPWKYGRIFDKVTYLNNAAGSSASEDLKHCLVFRQVDTIVLGQVTEPDELVGVLARFPKLATVYLSTSPDLGKGNQKLKDLLEVQLPRIEIVEMGRTDSKKPKPNKAE